MFEEAIREMESSGALVSEPRSFQEYLENLGISRKRTAQYISINRFQDLQMELRESGYMVLRLGSPPGSRNTFFSLSKKINSWEDYFLFDDDLFPSKKIDQVEINYSDNKYFAYRLLPRLTEASLLNLALITGIIQKSIGLDETESSVIPARVQSTFTFKFKPLSVSDIKLEHVNGQVEIDAIFSWKKDGKPCLVVIEAKISTKFDSIAKHKLYYPILALENKIPKSIEVIPIYLRVLKHKKAIEFNIAICELPRNKGSFGAIDEFRVKKVTRIKLPWIDN